MKDANVYAYINWLNEPDEELSNMRSTEFEDDEEISKIFDGRISLENKVENHTLQLGE
jgi:hypothetical protein